jgi:hypothetical protein
MTRDDIIRMAREALNGVTTDERMSGDVTPMFERFSYMIAAAAKAEEREACAKVCKEEICNLYWDNHAHAAAEHIANVIRARSNP